MSEQTCSRQWYDETRTEPTGYRTCGKIAVRISTTGPEALCQSCLDGFLDEFNKISEGWPKKIEEAQTIRFYDVGDGKSYARIPFGASKKDAWRTGLGLRCHDCAVLPGQYHVPGCDWEVCPKCGGQAIFCDCDQTDEEDEEAGNE